MKLRSADLYRHARIDEVEAAIVEMEQNGFMLDTDFCIKTAERARLDEQESLYELSKWLREFGLDYLAHPEEEGGINWASPTQVAKLFHETMGLPKSPVWKKGRVALDKGEVKLDETAIEWIRNRSQNNIRRGLDELIRLRRIRGSIKYLTKLPNYVSPDGYVHPVSGPASDDDSRAGTITWRLACKNPEVMQIPTNAQKDWYRIRKAFIAPPDHTILVADEKALEVVVLAHLLVRLFDDHQLADMVSPGAPDIHSYNARRVFGDFLGWERHGRRVSEFPLECFQSSEFPQLQQLRQDIKVVWYGLMYGKSKYGFATSLRDAQDEPIGEEAAGRIIEALYATVPGVPRYQAWVRDYVLRHHGIVGLGGAWCDLSELTKSGKEWAINKAVRIGQNYPCQEGGARIIGHAMVEITNDPWLREQGLKIERQVHDEFDFRVPLSADLVRVKEGINRHMTSYPLEAPLQVSIGQGDNWDDAG